jgi:hypothetical protein
MKNVFLLAICGVFLMACEEGDDDRLAQAQNCLDRSTQSTVSECEAMVGGLDVLQILLLRDSLGRALQMPSKF